MKRKQIYAVLLAGVLAAGSVPASVLAAEETPAATEAGTQEPQSQTAAGESTPAGDNIETSDDSGQTPAEQPQTSPQPSQEPAGEQSSQDNGTLAGEENGTGQVPQTQSGENQEEGTDTGEGQGDPGSDTEQDTGIAIVNTSADGTETPQYYNSLQEAVDAVATTGESNEATVIRISKMIALQNSVNVSGKKIRITSYAADGTIVRDAGFTGDMFTVSGEGSELQFAVSEGCVLVLDGKNVEGTAGSIVNVKDGAAFGISDGVTLTGNKTTAQGGAVTCTGGNIVLEGGSITGNSGANGAVYSDKDIYIQGTVTVKDNTLTDGSTAANLYLDGEAAFSVTGEMTNSTVSFTSGSPADQKTVLKAGVNEESQQITADQFKAAAAQFAYDNSDYSITLKDLEAVLEETKTEEPEPDPDPEPEDPEPDPDPEEPADPVKDSFLGKYQGSSVTWLSPTVVQYKVPTSEPCEWYYINVDKSSIKTNADANALYDPNTPNMTKAEHVLNIEVHDVSDGQYTIVYAKSLKTGNYDWKAYNLSASSTRPDDDDNTSDNPSGSEESREPYKYSVNESIVTGFESPLEFFPDLFYQFTVEGAGQNNHDPIKGDIRWIPLYWSTSSETSAENGQKSWQIGSENGIQHGATYNMYIFFRKEVYNGKSWVDTGAYDRMTVQFQSAEISDDEWNAWLLAHGVSEDELDNYGENGIYADVYATEAASYKDGESSTKSAVNTADESPLGTMSALAALSLAAGGYILVRKRKRES